jgi:carboxypeptidase Taq
MDALKDRLIEVHALGKAADLLEWDQEVMMPRGGAEARARHLAVLKKTAHEMFVAPDTGRLIEALAPAAEGKDDDESALVRLAAREWRRRSRQPVELVEALTRATALAQEEWFEARKASDFARFRPRLEEIFALKRRQAAALGDFPDPYDAWLEEFEPEMSTARVDGLFAEMKAGLIPLVKAVLAKTASARVPELHGRYEIPAQRRLGLEVARSMGFDFARGRLDESAHPFSSGIAVGDVRLTTRYDERLPFSALYGTMHEAGHGLYDQNCEPALKDTPLTGGATMAVHESQSRMWENQVGRSREFWRRWRGRFVELFPQAAAFSAEDLYRASNRVEASLIRVEADELTYGLHVLIRFELERELLSGRTAVADLPRAWAEKSKAYLGVVPPDDARGVLQDVHWASGLIGYFPTYAVGNMISAQLWNAALAAVPGIPAAIERGDGKPLLGWLVENVHRHGRKFGADELVRRACGAKLTARPYLDYLRAKYGELYGL